MTALAGGVLVIVGVIGVTRLIETGTLTGVTPSFAMPPLLGVVTLTMSVPVNVPLGRMLGSTKTVKSFPSGGRSPLVGSTLSSHGFGSNLAVKGSVWPGKPGTCTMIATRALFPDGTLTFGFVGGVNGASTTRTTAEFADVPHASTARTRE